MPGVVATGGSTSEFRPGAREADYKTTSKKGELGYAATFAKWSSDKKFLTMGNDKFSVSGVAEELGLDESALDALCLPVLLSSKPLKEAIIFCQNPRHQHHKAGVTAVAHRRPKGFKLDVIRNKHMTPVKAISKQHRHKGKGKKF